MTTVTFIDSSGIVHSVSTAGCSTLMEAAVEHGIPGIEASCGGGCSCATCHVHVDAAWYDRLPQASEDELALIEFADNASPLSRLSCQIKVENDLDGLTVRVAT